MFNILSTLEESYRNEQKIVEKISSSDLLHIQCFNKDSNCMITYLSLRILCIPIAKHIRKYKRL